MISLDFFIKRLYLLKIMGGLGVDDQLATGYAALQQRLVLASEGALRPFASLTPPLRGLASGLRIDNKTPSSPILIGASKHQPVAKLEAAIGLGLRHFGENKVQEAAEKWPALKAAHPGVTLHLIGPLQSNKAADAVALFDVIQTVDRPKIADALAAACTKTGKRPAFLIQVNIGEEPQKAGVAPKETAALLAYCQSLGLAIDGLMCVPPEGVNPAPYFALLAKMARELGLAELSMGMSGDFETAIRMGATVVRVGTALFGNR